MSKPKQGERGHRWALDEDGDINSFEMSYEFHNGPRCELCGYSYCEHCGPPTEDCTGVPA